VEEGKKNKSLIGNIADTLHKYRDVFYLLAIVSLLYALTTTLDALSILRSLPRAQNTAPSSILQAIDIPQVEIPPAPRGTAATRRVEYSDTVEFTFFHQSGRILDAVEVDKPQSPELDLIFAVLKQRLEAGSEDVPTPLSQNNGVTIRRIDKDGNDVVPSATTWQGNERYIRVFSDPNFVSPD